ncbi:MAG: trehalose-phosphatase [Actinobacteria bacterium]|nr:trehalose-phosphatase [Actinomycetota bacterium]
MPEPRTPGGKAGLAALLRDPARALIALDYDGTLSPIVSDPAVAGPHPQAAATLARLAGLTGTLAIITGRPAAAALRLGGLASVPGLIVLGQYGWERWHDGTLSSPPSPPGVAVVRERLPALLAEAGAPDGTRIEDKGHALAVHTRRTAAPEQTLDRLRSPLTALAADTGLHLEPGRLVLEIRPAGIDKGAALTGLAEERHPSAVLFAGDDLGDLPAFAAVRTLRGNGTPGLAVCSASAEATGLANAADLVVSGPDGVIALLQAVAAAIETGARGMP